MGMEWNGFKYAICNEFLQGLNWQEQCELAAQAGYKGIEIAPFTLVREGINDLSPIRRKEMAATMKNAGLECAGLHWLLTPPPSGLHATTPDEEIRRKTWEYIGKLIDFCGDLGGPVMVFGSPQGRSTAGGLPLAEATKYLIDGLRRVADHAANRQVKILIEPLGHNQTDVVNTMGEAVKLLHEIHHPAIQTMFDFHNTVDETELFHVIIAKHFRHIHHVHVQEMDGKYLGSGNGVKDYVQAFQKLKNMNYDQWVSLEVFDFSPGPQIIAQESMQALRRIEETLALKDGI